MKILGISAGTPGGSNDAMCKEALMGAQELGATLQFINLNRLELRHCTGCKACVIGLFNGRGNDCVLHDDFKWLTDQMYDADGIVWSVPIFEKGASGLFHTVMDRFGPRLDRGNDMIAAKIAEQGGKPIDPRYLQDRVVSYMGVGGSDWGTRIACDFGIQALTPKWTVVHNETFRWSLDIVMNDEAIARAHQIGRDTAAAAAKIADGTFTAPLGIYGEDYRGAPGICPHCHSRNFYLREDGVAICCQCGIEGRIIVEDGAYRFEFDAETQLPHAHDTISGKFRHGDDIQQNEGKVAASKQTDEYRARIAKYKAFIAPSLPPKA
jgi:multimeric flavodoxin WrbA